MPGGAVAITGATGFIGRALTAALLADGTPVRQLVRPGSDSLPGTTPVRWDPPAGQLDADGLSGVAGVVHLAGAGIGDRRWSAARKELILTSRTTPTRLLAEAVATMPEPPVLVSGSGIGYYGDGGDRELTEASPAGDLFVSEVCRAWEAATEPAEAAGARVVHLRTSLVLGARGGTMGRLLPLFRLGLGGRFGHGRQWWSWITLQDAVGVIRWALDHDELAGPVNVTTPDARTNADFTRALARALHRPAVLPVPPFGPGLLFGRQMVDELIMLSQRVVPTVLVDGGYPFAHPDLEGALAAVLA